MSAKFLADLAASQAIPVRRVENVRTRGPKAPASTVADLKQKVYDVSKAVGKTVDLLTKREDEAKLDRDLKARGQVALVDDSGEIVGITAPPYFVSHAQDGDDGQLAPEQPSEAQVLAALKQRAAVLQGIIDDATVSLMDRAKAALELTALRERIAAKESAMSPTDSVGMTRDERELARELAARGLVAAVNDRGEIVGLTSRPYWALDHDEIAALRARAHALQVILDDDTKSPGDHLRAAAELRDLLAKIQMAETAAAPSGEGPSHLDENPLP